MHEIAGLGELQQPWHSCQMIWLENHLNLINTYTNQLENLLNYRGEFQLCTSRKRMIQVPP